MKRIGIFLTMLLASVSMVLAQDKFVPDTTFCYKTTPQGQLMFDVFMPANHKPTDKRPVIIFFFGGGWVGGSTKQFYQQGKFFSEKGFVAISAEYRIANKHNTSPFECVSDGKSAIRWIRQHANSLGIDTLKVIAAGGSAGGHVAACTGIIKGYETEGENLAISSIPNALVLFNPVMDTGEKGYGMEKVGANRKDDISPVAHVKTGLPPTIIFHGTADKTVPFENVERFTKLMKEANNTCELVPFTGKDHGFFNSPMFRAKQKADDYDYNVIIDGAFAFLVKLKLDK
jgi:acetyl esterase